MNTLTSQEQEVVLAIIDTMLEQLRAKPVTAKVLIQIEAWQELKRKLGLEDDK